MDVVSLIKEIKFQIDRNNDAAEQIKMSHYTVIDLRPKELVIARGDPNQEEIKLLRKNVELFERALEMINR